MKQIIDGQTICRLCGLAVCCFLMAACAAHEPTRTSQNDPYRQFGKKYTPLTDSAGFVESGIASWYGHDFHGKKTSSGEVYDMHGMTAAHKILPLDTRVVVINPKNGRSVIVRINDRGPFVDGRIIDLSYAAASELGISMTGTGPVTIAALDKSYKEPQPDPDDMTASPADRAGQPAFSLQVGSFTSQQNAEELKSALAKKYDNVYIAVHHEGPKTFYRVRVGKYITREGGERALRKMAQDGYDNIKLVAE